MSKVLSTTVKIHVAIAAAASSDDGDEGTKKISSVVVIGRCST